MKTLTSIFLFIISFNNFCFCQKDSTEKIQTQHFAFGFDVLKTFTLFDKKDYNTNSSTYRQKFDMMFRFYYKDQFFINSRLGYSEYGTKQVANLEAYKQYTTGKYFQLGLGYELPTKSHSSILFGYNFGLSRNRSEYLIVNSNDYNGGIYEFFKEKNLKNFSEIMVGGKFKLTEWDKMNLFFEIDGKIRFALNNMEYIDNREYFAGYGRYSYGLPQLGVNLYFGVVI